MSHIQSRMARGKREESVSLGFILLLGGRLCNYNNYKLYKAQQSYDTSLYKLFLSFMTLLFFMTLLLNHIYCSLQDYLSMYLKPVKTVWL